MAGYYKEHPAAPYKNFDEFKTALGRYGERNQVNVDTANDWQIAKDVAANGYRCTCQVSEPVCPCPQGKRMAYEEGQCACGLLFTDLRKLGGE